MYMHDIPKKKVVGVNVKDVCSQRDFMRFDAPGHPPDALEKHLGTIEGKFASAIRGVVEEQVFNGEHAELVLNLMALLAVRSPEMRENIRDFHERVARQFMTVLLSERSIYEQHQDQLRTAGKKADVSFDEMKDFIERGDYRVTVPRERHIGYELDVLPTVLEELRKRRWTLYTTNGRDGEFVTTNRPVVLTYVDESIERHFLARSPGFAVPGTEVFFPLTSRSALVGRWEGRGHTEIACPTFIAGANTHLLLHSHGRVFSRHREVVYLGPTMDVHRDDALIDRFPWTSGPADISQLGTR